MPFARQTDGVCKRFRTKQTPRRRKRLYWAKVHGARGAPCKGSRCALHRAPDGAFERSYCVCVGGQAYMGSRCALHRAPVGAFGKKLSRLRSRTGLHGVALPRSLARLSARSYSKPAGGLKCSPGGNPTRKRAPTRPEKRRKSFICPAHSKFIPQNRRCEWRRKIKCPRTVSQNTT